MTSLAKFMRQFPDDDACWSHLEAVRWAHGPVCPKCGNIGPTSKVGRVHYHQCRACNAKFTVTFGTPLEGTHLPMRTWFIALYLLSVSSKGLSSVALARHLGIGQKTAWFLGHRIRAMMEDDSGLLRGIVEADETYLGGKRKRGTRSKRDDDGNQPKGRGGTRKGMVVAAVERGGKARAKRSGTHSGRTIASFLAGNVSRDSVLSTDELPAYRWIGRKFRAHLTVNHSRDEFVRNDPLATARAHSNTVESWNATLKRAIAGVWHWFSIKHTDKYCVETAFRWHHRTMDARMSAMLCDSSGRLPWKVLTA
jgi:transposase-like protein